MVHDRPQPPDRIDRVPGDLDRIHGYPLREAADTAIAAELAAHDRPNRVILCTCDALATMITTEALDAFKAQAPR